MKRLLFILILFTFVNFVGAIDTPMPTGYPAGGHFYPNDFVFNIPIDNTTLYPIATNNTAIITKISLGTDVKAGETAYIWLYRHYSVNNVNYTNVSPAAQKLNTLVSISDNVSYPIPSTVMIGTDSDHFMWLYDPLKNYVYESSPTVKNSIYNYDSNYAFAYDLSNMTARAKGVSSVSASGLPYSAGIIRADEINTLKEIRHAMLFSVNNGVLTTSNIENSGYIWPARHGAGYTGGTLRTGERLRLNASFDETGWTENQKIILQGLKKYGMFLVDSNGAGAGTLHYPYVGLQCDNFTWNTITGTKNFGYDGDLYITDFEVVDQSNAIISTNSWQAKTEGGTGDDDPPAEYVDAYAGYEPPDLEGVAPYSVDFTNISFDDPNNLTYQTWSFTNITPGNNTLVEFSYDEDPTYVFTQEGNYSIKLTVGNEYGYNTTPDDTWVNVSPGLGTAPVASFTKSHTIIRIPNTLTLTNTSTNTPTGFDWDYGDGTAHGTTAVVTHQYMRSGVFTITLTASNIYGSDAETSLLWVIKKKPFYMGIAGEDLMVNYEDGTYTASRELSNTEKEQVMMNMYKMLGV